MEKLEALRDVAIAGGHFDCASTASIHIEGGGYAILDYKSGEPRSLRWRGERMRDPQLLAYLMAERGRNVLALANVSLANGRAKFSGKSSHKGLLPGVAGLPGMNPNKVPARRNRRGLAGRDRPLAARLADARGGLYLRATRRSSRRPTCAATAI